MVLKEKLGKRIQELRKQRKLTQEKFAELVGIDAKNISKIESGRNYPSAETLTSISKTLNVELYELFFFGNEIPYEKMRHEIIERLKNDKDVITLYRAINGI